MTSTTDIRQVHNSADLIGYFAGKLGWNIDVDSFDSIDDISYEFTAADIGLNEDSFAKIKSLRQLRPLDAKQKWGMFCLEFDSARFEVSAVRKVLSALIPRKRKDPNQPVWNLNDILFLCDWGESVHRTVGLAHFEEHEAGLPQIKVISCTPSSSGADPKELSTFEKRLEGLRWPEAGTDWKVWSRDWSAAFTLEYRENILAANKLTVRLAEEARNIRDRILAIMKVESQNGYVHLLWEKFKRCLIASMTQEEFADTYAQTMVYGLFSARCMDKTPEDFSVEEAIDTIPSTNPFLKSLMRDCLGTRNGHNALSFDELEIGNVVELLLHADMTEIVADFNRQSGGGKEDPVLYFYERFAAEYDKDKKVRCGEFYTPLPVVNFIVRAVDDILKRDFGYEDGLASTATRHIGGEKRGKDVPAVQILDPATGTGTFLRQVILQCYENFKAKHKGVPEDALKTAWSAYVKTQLLPRLNGFELNMAPYAVAHMKLAMALKETGYDFKGNERLRVYLTNSLEEPGSADAQMTFWEDPIAAESIAANKAKMNEQISVVIGNPPYSVSSNNKGPWIQKLIEDYKKDLNERKINLDDDYIKFIRLGQQYVERNGSGILAFITNNSFIDGLTHRTMRQLLLKTFDKIYILNLHGNIRKKEMCPDGGKDENVFDIQQGVSINIFVKQEGRTKAKCQVVYRDLFGERTTKSECLAKLSLDPQGWMPLKYSDPYFFFVPKDFGAKDEYDKGFSCIEIFPLYNSGIQTKRDDLTISFDKKRANEVVSDVLTLNSDALRGKYSLKADGRDWTVDGAKEDLRHGDYKIVPCLYRPFDVRYTAYTGRSRGFHGYPRDSVMSSCMSGNVMLITSRMQTTFPFQHALATVDISDLNSVSMQTGEQSYVFPLYLYNDDMGKMTKTPNLDKTIWAKVEKGIGRKVTPEELFYYIYAVLHSPNYRTKYKEFLKIDFPRIPYPTNAAEFSRLASLGEELAAIHTMKDFPEAPDVAFEAEGSALVEKVGYADNTVSLSKTARFTGVEPDAWNMFIGGYQPLQKWLKDRKGRVLSSADISHYKRIVLALRRTRELMAKVDKK